MDDTCTGCDQPFEPDHVVWFCDQIEGSWHGPCFEHTPCGREEHGEGCPTALYRDNI